MVSIPLQALSCVIDRWATHLGEKLASDAVSRKFEVLDRLFPEQWKDIPFSHLSSNGSPIQLSVDSARPDELRIVIELSWLLTSKYASISDLAAVLPTDEGQLLTQLGQCVYGRVPRCGVGLRLRDGEFTSKIYIGSDSSTDFVPWVRSLSTHGLLPPDCDRGALRLCKHIAKSSIMRGCSFARSSSGELVICSVNYRSLRPFHHLSAAHIIHLAGIKDSSPTGISLANAVGFADGEGKGCFGHSVGIGYDGSVHDLKIEFCAIPWREGHRLSLLPLHQLNAEGVSSVEQLQRTIMASSCSEGIVSPEVVSWRGSTSRLASIVAYFALPRSAH